MTARSTITRSRLALTVPVLALAVLGADTVAYAATGTSLVVGKTNRAEDPTVLKNTGKGPALTLKSKRSTPSLRVSSRAVVPRLNADLVDGLDATALAPVTRQVTILPAHRLLTERYLTVKVPAGDHLISLNGVLQGDNETVCLVGEASRLTGPSEEEAILADHAAGLGVSASTVATLSGGDVIVGCSVIGDDDATRTLSPLTVTFRPVHGVEPLQATVVGSPFGSQLRRGLGD
jgi:hypothetical protein